MKRKLEQLIRKLLRWLNSFFSNVDKGFIYLLSTGAKFAFRGFYLNSFKMKFKSYQSFILGSVLLSGCLPLQEKNDERPNIMVIMLDDMGYSDLGCYGGEIQTPNIDALATGGVRFTQMHNTARCCPSRASLLTGHYPHKAGIDGMGVNLSMNTATIAEVLKENGYHTGMTGKWHLSETKPVNDPDEQLRWMAHQVNYGPFSPLENYPCNRGFDEHWGVIWGVVNFF